MDKVRRVIILVFLFWIVLAPNLGNICASADDHNVQNNADQEKSSKRIMQNSYSILTKSSRMYWEGIKSVMKQLQVSFFPPDTDFRSRFASSMNGDDEGHNGAGVKVKEAAEKSFQTSKIAVEESAKSAAKVVGETVHKTAEKMKERTSGHNDSPAEL